MLVNRTYIENFQDILILGVGIEYSDWNYYFFIQVRSVWWLMVKWLVSIQHNHIYSMYETIWTGQCIRDHTICYYSSSRWLARHLP